MLAPRSLAAVEAGDAINLAETDLRAVIREVLGGGWLALSSCDLLRLEDKREEERKRRPGAFIDEDLLAYTEFFELRDNIILKNWERFAGIWRSKRYFEAVFGRLEDFRNPDAHSRTLLPFEEHLVIGLAGEIRNTITRYRSTVSPRGEYYPIIELVEDSLGTRIVPSPPQQTGSNFKLGARLAVGDRVSFKLKAWDPQGRDIVWNINLLGKRPQEPFELHGAEARFDWEVSPDEVGDDRILINIIMSSTGEYHRNGKHDSYVAVSADVVPPR